RLQGDWSSDGVLFRSYWAQVEQHLDNELKRGNCLVLLDGLDEVGGDSTLSLVLRRFVEEFGRNQFVLTSRIVGLDPGPWHKLGRSEERRVGKEWRSGC